MVFDFNFLLHRIFCPLFISTKCMYVCILLFFVLPNGFFLPLLNLFHTERYCISSLQTNLDINYIDLFGNNQHFLVIMLLFFFSSAKPICVGKLHDDLVMLEEIAMINIRRKLEWHLYKFFFSFFLCLCIVLATIFYRFYCKPQTA